MKQIFKIASELGDRPDLTVVAALAQIVRTNAVATAQTSIVKVMN